MKCDRFVQNTPGSYHQALLFWPFLASQIPLDNASVGVGDVCESAEISFSACLRALIVCPVMSAPRAAETSPRVQNSRNNWGRSARWRQIAFRLRIQIACALISHNIAPAAAPNSAARIPLQQICRGGRRVEIKGARLWINPIGRQ
jgi:hypothetical protein